MLNSVSRESTMCNGKSTFLHFNFHKNGCKYKNGRTLRKHVDIHKTFKDYQEEFSFIWGKI